MKSKILAILLAVATFACASLPARQQAAVGLQTVLSTVSTARNLERAICDPAVAEDAVLTVCTEQAHELGLSDEQHKRFANLFATSFRQIAASSQEFQMWSVPEARPTLDQIVSTLHLINVEAQPLAGKVKGVDSILVFINQAILQIEKLRGLKANG